MNDDTLLTAEEVERRAAEVGVSVKQLCARAGIAHTTFYRWKTGQTKPRIDVYERLRAALSAAVREAA
jgi:transcriptional regulator with XRE-family HTH domain